MFHGCIAILLCVKAAPHNQLSVSQCETKGKTVHCSSAGMACVETEIKYEALLPVSLSLLLGLMLLYKVFFCCSHVMFEFYWSWTWHWFKTYPNRHVLHHILMLCMWGVKGQKLFSLFHQMPNSEFLFPYIPSIINTLWPNQPRY